MHFSADEHLSIEEILVAKRDIGNTVDESFWLLPPFYTDFGRNIRVGHNVFINHACEFMDRGGITIQDDVLIGPKVNLEVEGTSSIDRRC